MQLGIVGLPNVGKSTLFNALTKSGAQAENYPFCTIDPNIGLVSVPDPRLEMLQKLYNAKKLTPAVIEFVDIAGLVRGASKGEGLGNQFLSHIRNVDAIIQVVRCFDNDNVTHVDGSVDPVRDMDTISLELIFADIETVEKRIDRTRKQTKSGDAKIIAQASDLEKILDGLESGMPVRVLQLSDTQNELCREMCLLTIKPTLYVVNVSEDDYMGKNPYVDKVSAYAMKTNAEVLLISAQIEEELALMEHDDAKEFLLELGLKNTGLDRLVDKSYKLLGLMSYLTAGEKEVRAWTVPYNTKAPQAAGKIHTDFERGFIRAEVVKYADLIEHGSVHSAKEHGLVKSEGKEYIMQKDDVVLFRFNV
ncbi:MAG: redox-regulated ATPase YchF [Clostridiales bacterium]|nr:redox-regulated ATPase YchF [Clostridiales bacterium]